LTLGEKLLPVLVVVYVGRKLEAAIFRLPTFPILTAAPFRLRPPRRKEPVDVEMTRINPPLYLASTTITCRYCKAAMHAVALIAPNVPETEGDVCILCDITELPDSVLSFIQSRFPTFRRQFSKSAQSEYFANTCPVCGVLSGDHYLHSEPGAPFFPTTDEEARRLTIDPVALQGSIDVQASLRMGSGDLILNNGRSRESQ